MDDVSRENRAFVEHIFYTYIIRIIAITGIFGNIAILIVLTRRGTKETAFVYIRALAAVDLSISLVVLGLCYVRSSGAGDETFTNWDQQYYRRFYEGYIYLPIANAAQMANLFITIAMAVHRVASVVKIHNGIDMYTIRINVSKSRLLAKRVVAIILIFSAAVNMIRFFFHTIEEVSSSGNDIDYRTQLSSGAHPGMLHHPAVLNHSRNVVPVGNEVNQQDLEDYPARSWRLAFDLTNCSQNWNSYVGRSSNTIRYKLANTKFHEAIYQYFMVALSTLHFCELLILTTVNIILIGVLRRSKNQRKTLIRSEVQQRKKSDDITRLLVTNIIVHIVCHLHSPFSADPIANYVFGPEYVKTNTYHIQLVINNALTLTSHAVTFFLSAEHVNAASVSGMG